MNIIRADGNSVIGMGHIMRCLAIADAMEDKPIFVTACEECGKLIQERGYRVSVLPTDYREMESELSDLEKIVVKKRSFAGEKPVFLVDSYQATEDYFRRLRELGAVACLEDFGVSRPVDLLINYNLYGKQMKYADDLRTLLGTGYVPLRREFTRNRNYKIWDNVRNVLITTGGGDPFFAAAGLLDGLLKEQGQTGSNALVFHVVSGPVNRYAGELKTRYESVANVRIHENVSDMKGLMEQCDVAITASGSTVYELCSIGLPMICFYFAENQKQGAECLAQQTEIVNIGNYAHNRGETVERARQALKKCLDYEYRKRLWEQERQLVDGQGAARIAEELGKL